MAIKYLFWSCKAISSFLWLQQAAAAFSSYPWNHSWLDYSPEGIYLIYQTVANYYC